MGDHSAIEWCDATWNPTVGCDKVSAGCTHCYAITQAYRLEHGFKQPAYQGLTRKPPDGSVNWTGVVRTLPERLEQPLRWKKPAKIFVDSMSDLFHEDVPDEFIVKVFRTMLRAHWHTFQILTKRPERMRQFVWNWHFALDEWKMPANIWLGTSVEDQRAADERIPLLLQTPAAVRFLSAEPLLGPIDLSPWLSHGMACDGMCDEDAPGTCQRPEHRLRRPNWIIAGGESGPNYRPCDPEWVRSLRDQCQAAHVAFHFKQWGGRTHAAGGRLLDGRTWDEFPEPAREGAHVTR